MLRPAADGAAIVIVGNNHRRGKTVWVCLDCINDVTVVAVAQVLDKHGLVDACTLHVKKQGFDRLVFVQTDVAVGVNDVKFSLFHSEYSF